MSVRLFFNELSLQSCIHHDSHPKSIADEFVSLLFQLVRSGTDKALYRPADFLISDFGSGYTFSKWIDEKTDDLDRRRFFKSIISKVPNIETMQTEDLDLDVSFNGVSTIGFLYSYLHDGISVSLFSSSIWDFNSLSVEINKLDEEGEIEPFDSYVRHASQCKHVENHENYIINESRISVNDGENLIDYLGDHCPNILLCESAKVQISELSPGNCHFLQVRKLMFSLTDYVNKWDRGQFDPRSIDFDISPESKATMQQYSAERTFTGPEGKEITFSLHAKITPESWRVYVHPDSENKTITIGYVGKHLRTQKFN